MKRQTTKSPFTLNSAGKRATSAALALAVAMSLAVGAMTPVVADTKSKTASKTARGLTEDQKTNTSISNSTLSVSVTGPSKRASRTLHHFT